jgi:hypothetical protein
MRWAKLTKWRKFAQLEVSLESVSTRHSMELTNAVFSESAEPTASEVFDELSELLARIELASRRLARAKGADTIREELKKIHHRLAVLADSSEPANASNSSASSPVRSIGTPCTHHLFRLREGVLPKIVQCADLVALAHDSSSTLYILALCAGSGRRASAATAQIAQREGCAVRHLLTGPQRRALAVQVDVIRHLSWVHSSRYSSMGRAHAARCVPMPHGAGPYYWSNGPCMRLANRGARRG